VTEALLYDIGTAVYALGVIAVALFTLHYAITSPFERTPLGRGLIIMGATVVVSSGLRLVQFMTESGRDDYDPADIAGVVYRLASFTLFALGMIALLTTYLRERYSSAPEEREKEACKQ
jgi:hypothetical protein